jgi:predicted Co/Zn/Cd cation transporter (cation efflux family)
LTLLGGLVMGGRLLSAVLIIANTNLSGAACTAAITGLSYRRRKVQGQVTNFDRRDWRVELRISTKFV